MPDVNEEDYLDSLLKSMSENQETQEQISDDEIEERKIKEQVQEALLNTKESEVDAFDDSDEDVDSESESITPEEVAKHAKEDLTANAVADSDIDEIADDDLKLKDEKLDENIDKMLEDTDISDIANIENETESSMNDISGELSEGELERLVNMNLDDIIDDATAENVSVDDLFNSEKNNHEIQDETENGKNDESADKDSEEINKDEVNTTSESNEAEKTNNIEAESETEKEDDVSAAEILGMSSGLQNEDSQTKDSNKDNAKKAKKKNKKSFLTVLKNIFFESIEDDNLEKEAVSDNKNISSDAQLDENEKIIEEVYGGKEHVDDVDAPKKGFFEKFKYRLQQRKKHNEEQNQLELEAEEQEEQEKKKKKEEKKAAAKENKEKKKTEKAAKPKKEKKPKAKKEKKPKKPKEPPKPGDILKIKPKSMIFFVLFIAGIIVLIQVMNMSMQHGNGVANAKSYYANGDYMKAYDSLTGIKLSKSEQTLYDQSSCLMYVQRQLDAYNNYMQMNMQTEALNSLIKGIDRYNTYYKQASELGVAAQMDSIKKNIIDELQNSFKVSETEANTLVDTMNKDFTKYYTTIEAYGEAKK